MSVFSIPVTIGVNEEEIAKEIRKNVEDRVVEKLPRKLKRLFIKKNYMVAEKPMNLCAG